MTRRDGNLNLNTVTRRLRASARTASPSVMRLERASFSEASASAWLGCYVDVSVYGEQPRRGFVSHVSSRRLFLLERPLTSGLGSTMESLALEDISRIAAAPGR